tara:strand:+ start:252 stop:503 length:252 start_codon:yes stop_codon:yes gene_type:complete
MSQFVDLFKQKCENCNRIALPLCIAGSYISGEKVVIHQCSFCNYLRFHGQLGFKGERKRKAKPVAKQTGGRLSRYLLKRSERA